MTRHFTIFAAICLYACVVQADDPDEFWSLSNLKSGANLDFLSVVLGADVRSAYQSRAKICEARPVSSQLVSGNISLDPLAPVGRVGVDFWTISSLTHKMDAVHKNMFFQERDFTVRYGYDWQVAAGWRLSSDVMSTWVMLPGYTDGLDHTTHEWRCGQRLENPWITPFYLVRRSVHPRDWLYVRIGVQHKFQLTDSLSFTPCVFGEGGNENHYQQRYGAKDPAWSKYHSGLQALNMVFTLSWKVSSWASLYASVQQFGIVDADARDRTKASKSHNARRDLTIGTIGVTCTF